MYRHLQLIQNLITHSKGLGVCQGFFLSDTVFSHLILMKMSVKVERNYEMIDNSRFCIVYSDESHAPTTRKSGTMIALDCVIKKGRKVILV